MFSLMRNNLMLMPTNLSARENYPILTAKLHVCSTITQKSRIEEQNKNEFSTVQHGQQKSVKSRYA